MSTTEQTSLNNAIAGRKRLFTRKVNPNSLSLTISVTAFSIVINVLGGTFVGLLNLPFLFLDSIGTFFTAAVFGPAWGVLAGVITNLVLGVTSGPTSIPFALVQVVIALIVGLISNTIGYNLKGAALSAVLVAFIAPLIGTLISVTLFGGLVGHGIDLFVVWLAKAGQSTFGAAFWPRLGSNLVDKFLTAFIVLALVKRIPSSLIKPRTDK